MLDLTSEESAYIAGIIDGEGCIHLTKSKPKPRYKTRIYQLKVSITNTNEKMINWLYGKIGGYLYRVKKNYHAEKNPNARVYWHITLSTAEAHELLRVIRPYLVAKSEQADIAMQFHSHIQECKHAGYKRLGVKKGRPILSDAMIDFRESLYNKLIELRKSDTYLRHEIT